MKLFVSLFFLPLVVSAQVDHWESVVQHQDIWSYLVPASEPPSTWKNVNFDDSGWDVGESGIGYGDDDDNTIISPTLSLYIRREFEVVDKAAIAQMVLHMDYDDGFVAYLNGTEIARATMLGTPPLFDQTSNGLHEALLYQGITPEGFEISPSEISALLIEGNNALAIQIHNFQISSSDLTAIPVLSLGISDNSQNYQPVPSWFQPPLSFIESNLPIVVFETNGTPVTDEPKAFADIGIIYNGPGVINRLTDPWNEYAGIAGIEIRGESSQSFAKKSYGFEMWDDQGNDIDTSFLNFPAEEDFILHGPYSDKSLFNNVLTMDIANELGYYSSRTRFVELVLNGDYKGVYVVMEKVKRDGDRVDIATLGVTEISGDDLTGGYIFRIDKGPHEGWASNYNAYGSDNPIFFQYYYPNAEIITAQQKSYIQNYTREFEEAIASTTYKNNRGKHYLDYIDLRSFVDNFILNELSKNVDAYRLSTYFHKDKDSKGGKIIAGPYWDFNLAYGNGDYCGGDDATGWEYYQCVGSSPFWWDAMLKNPDFANALRCRWVELRQTILSTSSINTKLDAFVSELGESRARNFQRWPIMGTYVWPNSWFYAQSANHDEVIGYMKQWIEERSIWMDQNIPGSELDCHLYEPPYVDLVTGLENEATITLSIFPNPATDILNILSDQTILEISIINILGQPVLQEFPNSSKFQLNLNSIQNKGIFLIRVKSRKGSQTQRIRIR